MKMYVEVGVYTVVVGLLDSQNRLRIGSTRRNFSRFFWGFLLDPRGEILTEFLGFLLDPRGEILAELLGFLLCRRVFLFPEK